MRKASLARLLARRVDGIFLSDFEQGEIGPTYSATGEELVSTASCAAGLRCSNACSDGLD